MLTLYLTMYLCMLIFLSWLKHHCINYLYKSPRYGQHHAKRDLRTYPKSVDSDQPPRLRRCVWSKSALFDTRHIKSTDNSCRVSNWIAYSCFQYCIAADLGLHYLWCPKVHFRVTLAKLKWRTKHQNGVEWNTYFGPIFAYKKILLKLVPDPTDFLQTVSQKSIFFSLIPHD